MERNSIQTFKDRKIKQKKTFISILGGLIVLGGIFYLGTLLSPVKLMTEARLGSLTTELEQVKKDSADAITKLNEVHSTEIANLKSDAEKRILEKQKECDDANSKLIKIQEVLGLPNLQKTIENQKKEIESLK